MAIERKHQKIFGDNLTALGNIAAYGSKKAGSPTFSDNLDIIQTASWLQGIMGATSSDKAPYVQDLNAIFYVITKQLAYLFQAGIAEWDSQTDYFAGKSVVLKNGKIYIATSDNKNIEPEVTSGWDASWKVLTDWTSLTGDLKKNRDLVSYIAKGYYAVCSTPRTTNIKEITIPEFVANGIYPPNGTKVTILFAYGSNTDLNNTELKINLGNGDYIQHSIHIDGFSTLSRKFCATNDEFIEFIYHDGAGFSCENRISAFSRVDGTTIEDGRWYKIYRDGRYEEQGFYSRNGSTSQIQITLSKELSQTNYYIGLTARGGLLRAYVNNITTTGFIVKSSETSFSTDFNWKVEGLLK